jgi:hypothetical protein
MSLLGRSFDEEGIGSHWMGQRNGSVGEHQLEVLLIGEDDAVVVGVIWFEWG